MTPAAPTSVSHSIGGNHQGQSGAENAFLVNLESGEMKSVLTEDSDISQPLTDQGSKSPDLPWTRSSDHVSLVKSLQRRIQSAFDYYLNSYVLCILTAIVGQTLMAASMRVLSDHINVFQAVALRSFICGMSMFLFCRLNGISLMEPREKLPLFFLRGVIGACGFVTLTLGWCELPLSDSAFMTNSYPVLTAVLSWSFGMEELGILTWIGAFGCLIGNALVAHPPFLFGGSDEWDSSRIVGIVSACLGNLFMAFTYILLNYLGKSVNTIALTAYMNLFSFLFSIPFMLVEYPMELSMHFGVREVLCFCAICLSGLIAHPAMSRALQIGPPTKVTSLFMMNMLLTGAVGVVALNESVSWLSLVGATVIIISVVLVTAQGPRRPNQYQPLASGNDREMEI